MAAEPTGTFLTLDDGRPAVRFTRVYDHPVARVWRFVTDPDELAHWFPSRAEIELRAGGTVTFSEDPNLADSTGRVLAVEDTSTTGGSALTAVAALREAGAEVVAVAVVVDRDTGAAERVEAEGLPYLSAVGKDALGLD